MADNEVLLKDKPKHQLFQCVDHVVEVGVTGEADQEELNVLLHSIKSLWSNLKRLMTEFNASIAEENSAKFRQKGTFLFVKKSQKE
jgi:hypothetical protein